MPGIALGCGKLAQRDQVFGIKLDGAFEPGNGGDQPVLASDQICHQDVCADIALVDADGILCSLG